MGFSNAPDPLLPHCPISTTEADLPLNVGDLAASGALPASALRQNNARGQQATRCKCGALCLTSQPSCPNCGEANWESCLDCGRSAGADSFFCEPCGDQRERAAEQYQRHLIDRLSEARKLRAAHRFDEAIAVLRDLADTGLRKGDAEKVQCRIARIHEWRDCQAEQMRAQVKQARRLIEQDCYELAATLLKQVVEPFRDAEVERLEQLARTRRHELARLYRQIQQAVARKRPATALRAAERLLTTAPNYKRAPAVRKLRRDCYLLQASGLIKKQRFEAALALLEKIPTADRNHEVESLTATAKCHLPSAHPASASPILASPILASPGRQPSEIPPTQKPNASHHAPSSPPEPPPCVSPPLSARATNATASSVNPASRTIPTAAEPEPQDWLHELTYVNRLCLGNEWLPWVLAVYANTLLIILLYGFNAWASDPLDSRDKQIFLTAGFVDPIQDEGLPVELASPEPLPIEQPQDEVPPPLRAEEIPSIAIELLSLEPAGEDADEPQPIEPEPLPEPEPLEPEPPAEVTPVAEQTPEELEQPDPEPPAPAHAVENGNFIVWSEPMMPIAGEPYSVFVRIRVPDRITRYPRSDLTGIVIGSDGYQKLIRDTRDGFLPLVGHTATIILPIVGATRPEADTLILRSRLLKQQKTVRLLYRRS